jgi:hypothetical protein
MKGGALFKFSVGRVGTSGANIKYITREKAAGDRISTRNLPEYAQEGESRKEQVNNLYEYARQREEDELSQGKSKNRTHYRAIYSFDREVTDEQAQRIIDEHLDRTFPNTRTISTIHRDTDNVHAHTWIDARATDGKKINLDNKTYKSLDERWAEIYSREFGERELYDEHLLKKQKMQDWKREAYNAHRQGKDAPAKPPREADYRNQITERRAMEAKQYGGNYDESTARGNQRPAIERERTGTAGESAINRAEREIDALNKTIAETNRAIEQANRQMTIERDYDDSER